jgi:hypothetical protein
VALLTHPAFKTTKPALAMNAPTDDIAHIQAKDTSGDWRTLQVPDGVLKIVASGEREDEAA